MRWDRVGDHPVTEDEARCLAASVEMDAIMAELPGLEGLRIFHRARREAFSRADRIPARPPGVWKRAPDLVVVPKAERDALAG